MELSKGDSMRNRMKELTDEEIKEQQAYVQEATKHGTVNKSATARAGASLGCACHGGPHLLWVDDDRKPQPKQD